MKSPVSNFKGLLFAMMHYYNWYDALLLYFGLKNESIARHRTGQKFIAYSKDDFFAGVEVFIDETYRELKVSLKPGTTLIDIGAFIGDSAIYFAEDKRVKQVFAFEAFPYIYELAKKNIELNGMKRRIMICNNAISDKKRVIRLPVGRSTMVSGIDRPGSAEGSRKRDVRCIPLNSITKRIRGNIAIKSDCEGEEYRIFRNADLRKVYAIQMEYHNKRYGQQKEMVTILKSRGFDVKVSGHRALEDKSVWVEVGIIFAKRRKLTN